MLDYYLHVFGRKCPKRAGKKIPKFPKEDTYITKDMYYTPIARLNWQNSSNSIFQNKKIRNTDKIFRLKKEKKISEWKPGIAKQKREENNRNPLVSWNENWFSKAKWKYVGIGGEGEYTK